MSGNFPLLFYTFDKTSDGFLFEAEVSAKTLNMIEIIYDKINERCQRQYDNNKLENSLFCCFFDEGFFLYSFFNINSGRMISMKGIFVPKQYIRIAWRIYLRQIMYMTAADIFRNSEKYKYFTDYEWISGISENAKSKLSDEYIAKIDRYFNDMQKDIPNNFAMTNYPIRKLPIAFTIKNNISISAEEYQEGKIVMQESTVKQALAELNENEPYLSSVYVLKTLKKHFVELKKNEMKEMGMKKSEIKSESEELESELKMMPCENVWYVLDNDSEGSITQQFDQNTIRELETGIIDFSTLSMAVKSACREIAGKKSVRNNTAQEQTAEKKKGGFLGSFFGKKQ